MWGCGLKSLCRRYLAQQRHVTPYVGVWIEINLDPAATDKSAVTPYVGVWIEMR